jgi:hypothetical protein
MEYSENAWFISLGYEVAGPLILAVQYEDLDEVFVRMAFEF